MNAPINTLPLHMDMWEAAWVSEPGLYRLVTVRVLERFLALAEEPQIDNIPRLHVLLVPALEPELGIATVSLSKPQDGVSYLSIQYMRSQSSEAENIEAFDKNLVNVLGRFGNPGLAERQLGQVAESRVRRTKLVDLIGETVSRLHNAGVEELAMSGDKPLRLIQREKLIPSTFTSTNSSATLNSRLQEAAAQYCEVMSSGCGADDPVDLGLTALRYERLSQRTFSGLLFSRRIAGNWKFCDALSQCFEGRRNSAQSGPLGGAEVREFGISGTSGAALEFLPIDKTAPFSVCLVPAKEALVVGYTKSLSEEHAREYVAQVMLWKERSDIRPTFGDTSGAVLRGLKTPLIRELLTYLNSVEDMPIGSSCLVTFRVLWLLLHEQNPKEYAERLLEEISSAKNRAREKIGTLTCGGAQLAGQHFEAALLLVGFTTPLKELQKGAPIEIPFENLVAMYDLEKVIEYAASGKQLALDKLLPGFENLWKTHGKWESRY